MHVSAAYLLDALSEKGYRITRARVAICEVIAESHDQHLDASLILQAVRARGSTVDQSTVYRTLDALEESGLVTHGHLGHRAAVYHLAQESVHQHLVCDNCGETISVDAATLSEWTRSIRGQTGFVVEPSHFALSGLCEDCATSASETG